MSCISYPIGPYLWGIVHASTCLILAMAMVGPCWCATTLWHTSRAQCCDESFVLKFGGKVHEYLVLLCAKFQVIPNTTEEARTLNARKTLLY